MTEEEPNPTTVENTDTTSNSLQNEVENWSLQSDVKLIEYLGNMSDSIKEKTSKLTESMEDLDGDVSVADVRLRNTFNEFFMLANSQFIENVSRLLIYLL